jgi:hypothetical protein
VEPSKSHENTIVVFSLKYILIRVWAGRRYYLQFSSSTTVACRNAKCRFVVLVNSVVLYLEPSESSENTVCDNVPPKQKFLWVTRY